MTFGEKLKAARNISGLSQEQFAEALNISRSAVAKWENNIGIPDVSNLKGISKLLNISIDSLLDENDDIENKDISLGIASDDNKIQASGPITSWQIDGETVEMVSDFIFLSSKITADGDCSHEISVRLAPLFGDGDSKECVHLLCRLAVLTSCARERSFRIQRQLLETVVEHVACQFAHQVQRVLLRGALQQFR